MGNTNTLLVKDKETPWDRTARTRWGSYISEIERRAILNAAELAEGNGMQTALEIGCGGGRWSLLLANRGWEVACTDIYPSELSICQERIPKAKCILVKKDDFSLPCEAESIGLLLCIEVPEVISSDWFITEACRVLCPSGILVGVFTNKLSIRGFLHNLGRTARKLDVFYKIAYPHWRNKLLKHGFKLITEEGLCWAPFSRHSNSLLVPLFTRLEKILGLRQLPGGSPWVALVAQKEEFAHEDICVDVY